MLNKRVHLPITALLFAIFLTITGGCGTEATDTSAKQKPVKRSTSGKVANESRPAGAGDSVAGKIVYEKHCHYCHGRKGRGKGPVSIAVEPNPADFISDKKRMAVTDAALYKSISEGISKESGGQKLEKALAMPPFMGVLTAEERWDVIAYVRELVKNSKGNGEKK